MDRKYLIVMNIFQSVADHTDAHVDQVRGGHLEDLLGELLTILVDLLCTIRGAFTGQYTPHVLHKVATLVFDHISHTNLHSQMGDDGSLMSLQGLQSNLSNLRLTLAHKHLTGSGQHLLVLALDLNLQQQEEMKTTRELNLP